jgi:hypothetical protein
MTTTIPIKYIPIKITIITLPTTKIIHQPTIAKSINNSTPQPSKMINFNTNSSVSLEQTNVNTTFSLNTYKTKANQNKSSALITNPHHRNKQ